MLFKKKEERISWDETKKKPVIRASICTGERVAGFQDLSTGAFEEIMLIRSEGELRTFRERYGITGEIKTIY
ncbi:MAG: aspartate dehydrogenase [Eubacterium sp.]|nr:aspartate dehydrogenase [Eubacterium sp.]MBR6173037.1 aspartate dehydrogenase [Eubacterium sp.]